MKFDIKKDRKYCARRIEVKVLLFSQNKFIRNEDLIY